MIPRSSSFSSCVAVTGPRLVSQSQRDNGGMSAVKALLLAIPMSIKTKEREREQEIDEADGGILFLALGDDMPQAPSIGIRLNH